jgi:iduronate 2-sulfatase
MQKILAFILISIFTCSCFPSPNNLDHPNILMISVDDMNTWVSFLKNFNNVKTPNLDKLARKSYVFKNAHAPATLCNPSRTAVITGRLPSSTGIYTNAQSAKDFITKTQTKVIFQHFKEHGYYVLGAGKLFHVKNDIEVFDEFFRPKRDLTNIGSMTPWGYCDETNNKNVDNQVANWAASQLTRNFEKPFFMSVGFFFPHHPWIMPKKYFDYYPLEKIKIPETLPNDYDDIPVIARTRILKFLVLNSELKNHNQLKQNIQAYLAAITYMDEQLGRILTALENSPHAKNTIIVFWSDHGYHLGEKQTLRKSTLWDSSTNIPFLISIPGKKAKIQSAVSLIDIFPTLIELAQLPSLPGLEGTSLVNLLNNKKYKRSVPVITVQEQGNYAIRNDNWKYIRYVDGSEEFYNIIQDPHEYNNLANNSKYFNQKNNLKKFIPKNEKQNYDSQKNNMIWIKGFNSSCLRFYSFWIDRHEVTNQEFSEFVKQAKYKTSAETLRKPGPGSLVFSPPSNPVEKTNYLNWWKFIPNASWRDPQGDGRALQGRMDHPVVQVSYHDALAFCKHYGKRLPSEAEWKIAGSDLKEMNLQKKSKRWNLNIYQGNFPYKDSAEDGFAGTAPVMSYQPDSHGLYDLAGNTWEWVATKGDKPNSYKIKGGSFLCGNHCQGFDPSISLDMQADESTDHIGFRCVD